jgi:hypothetical protein
MFQVQQVKEKKRKKERRKKGRKEGRKKRRRKKKEKAISPFAFCSFLTSFVFCPPIIH